MTSTDAQKRASMKYAKTHLKRIPFDVKIEEYERIKAAADAAGESVRGFILKATLDRIEKMNDPESGS